MNKTNAIGVFDSGLGGISVLKQLYTDMPNEQFIYFGDSAYAPYGTKPKEKIIERCIEICDYFMDRHVKAIVVACNTATSVAIETLRTRYPIPIIGMEPALKLAAHHKQNQNIVVMATPLTLKEEKFAHLMSCYDQDNHIIKMPCPELVKIVESDRLENKKDVMAQLQIYYKGIDTTNLHSIVLGCTHFVFYRPYFLKFFPHIAILDGNVGTSHHLKHILLEHTALSDATCGSIEILNSTNKQEYIDLSKRLFNHQLTL